MRKTNKGKKTTKISMYSKSPINEADTQRFLEIIENDVYFQKSFFEEEEAKQTRDIQKYTLSSFMDSLTDYLHKSLFIENDLSSVKNFGYNIAKLMELDYSFKKNKLTEVLCATVDNSLYASYLLISDYKPFVKRFKAMDYAQYGNTEKDIWTRRKQMEMGRPPLFTFAMYCMADEDFDEVEKLIVMAEKLRDINSLKSRRYHIHADIWRAIRDQDKDKLSNNILLLIEKTHRYFNDDYAGKFISRPALGYLKVAWILGLEVEVNHKYIPMELMPVKPLEKYENLYPFLLPEFI